MSPMRRLLLTLLAAAALATGCGGTEAGSTTDSAAIAPSGAGLYASIDTDRSGDQWTKLEAVLSKLPGGETLLDSFLEDAFEDVGGPGEVDFERDVEPAVGDELVGVIAADQENPVVLVQPADEDKLRELLDRGNGDAVTREIDGWTAIAKTEATLDDYEAALAKGRLADDPDFRQATADLPPDTLLRAYFRGAGLRGLVARAGAAAGALGGLAPGTQAVGSVALAVAAEDDGLRVVGSVEQKGLPASFSPKLLPRVPAGAFVAGTFTGEGLSEQLRGAIAGKDEQLRQFEKLTGLELERVLELFTGEVVFYVRPGLPIPEITLAIEAGGGRLETVDAMFRRLAAQEKTTVTKAVEDGVTVHSLTDSGVTIRYAETDGLVVVTTGARGIRDLVGSGEKLVDDDDFAAATREVDYDGSTTGLVYVDVDAIAPLLQGFLGLAGGTPGAAAGLGQLADALESFEGAALNVVAEGDRASFEGFLQVG